MSKKKKIKSVEFVESVKKQPKHSYEPTSWKGFNLSWQFNLLDMDTPWCKKYFKSQSDFYTDLLPILKQFECINWFDLDKHTHGYKGKSKHHNVDINDICQQAQKRLSELKLDEYSDQLFSLRINATFRIWGIRESGYLKILWFDPEHEVYPSGFN